MTIRRSFYNREVGFESTLYLLMEGFKVQLGFVLMASFVNSALLTQLYAYIGLFVESFGIADRSSTGYYTGYLSSSFMVGRMISSSVWGWLTDHWGRKPSLVYSLWLVGFASLGVGLSESFTAALFFRFMSGFLNSLLVTTKTLISEICPEDYQAQGMSWQTLIRICGQISGILIGILPDPEYVRSFQGTLLEHSPFFLPNALIALLCFTSAIGSHIYLTETLDKPTKPHPLSTPFLPKSLTSPISNTYLTLFSDRTVKFLLLIYGLNAATHGGLKDVVSIWAWARAANGGLEMSIKTIGMATVAINVGMAVLQHVLFARLTQAKGYIWVLTCTCLCVVPFTLLTPQVYYLRPFPVLFWVYFLTSNCLSLLCYQHIFSVEFILINNSVHRRQRGKMNGLSLTTSSLARSLSVPLYTSLFAFTSTSGASFPLDFTCAFTVISLVTLLSWALCRYLPCSLERSKDFITNNGTFN